jgi:alcohol dehydrogenase class IV
MRTPSISYLTDIHFGQGAADFIPEIAKQLGMRRPLVVTDGSLVRLGLIGRLSLEDCAVFSGTETNPTEGNLTRCVDLYRESDCDGFIGVGGGASIDLAKLAAMMTEHPPPIEQYAAIREGSTRITSAMPPLIAVPTTAGSGSEVGRAALLRLDSGRKLGFISPHLLPKAAICDPELTVTLPAGLTAATGMDAISHCVEAYCSPRFNPVADAIALEGLARGWRAIRKACSDGADIEAREQMLLCSLMGGLAFQKGLGAVHSLSHPLGALDELRLHHGTLNALFLVPVLRFNAEASPERMDGLAGAIGASSGMAVPDVFDALLDELSLPRRLRVLGVSRAVLASLAHHASEDHCSATNPRRFDDVAARMLYEEVW